MTKKYNSPMLQVVSIKGSNIITTSGGEPDLIEQAFTGTSNDILAPGKRGLDDWDAGY